MPQPPESSLFAEHPREFAENRYVYPVLSRRAGGVSLGVNLNLDALCNFNCVYCQVVRGKKKEGSPAADSRSKVKDSGTVEITVGGRASS